jgi:hypothetical protein
MTPSRNVALMCPATTKADVDTHTSVFPSLYEDRGERGVGERGVGERAVVNVVGSGAARVVSGRRAAAGLSPAYAPGRLSLDGTVLGGMRDRDYLLTANSKH